MKKALPGAAAVVLCLAACLAWAAADHAAAFRALPKGVEILYLPGKYKACIPCHPRNVFEDEDFNVDTLFRDAARGKNLHWMHVFRQPQGTNCSCCHRVDEGTGVFGYPPGAGVEIRPTGGVCTPLCHRQKEYKNGGRSGS